MKALAKRIARRLLGDYSIYRIYRKSASGEREAAEVTDSDFTLGPVGRDAIEASADALIREQGFYCGEGAHAFACRRDARIVGLCFFWHGERYRMRNFWPLADNEAKLVQIVTLPEARGQGVAARLLEHGAREMARHGFTTLFARIWHSNQPSIAAFERAGWIHIATVIETRPLGRRESWRMTLRR